MFVKLFTQILDSSIADDRRLRHFFTDILLCADMKGFVMMTESAISRRIGAPLDEVEWGLAELEKPDPRSKTPDCDGRRIERLEGSGYGWKIINFETYRALKSAEDMREKTRERVRRFRSKSKTSDDCNADVTPCNAGNDRQKQKQRAEEETETSPPTPPRGAKGASKIFPTTPQAIRIAQHFHRKSTTAWDPKEVKAFKAISPIDDDDLDLVLRYEESERAKGKDGWHKRDMVTLLNQFQRELDRARAWDQESNSTAKSKSGFTCAQLGI